MTGKNNDGAGQGNIDWRREVNSIKTRTAIDMQMDCCMWIDYGSHFGSLLVLAPS